MNYPKLEKEPPFKVPEKLTRQQVKDLARRFVPIMERDGKFYRITPKVDYFDQSFQWSAEPTGLCLSLRQIDEFYTVHSYGYYGIFKPSICEVIQQIPEQHLGLKKAFFLTMGPEDKDDLVKYWDHINAGVHVAVTRLYVKKGLFE